MRKIWNWIKNNPNRAMFLVPILLVAGISISHVISWYDIANPYMWALYLSIAIEVGAITALVAATNKIKGGVWFMFGLVTFIQFIGNIFYCYKEIDPNSESFKMWVELTSFIWDTFSDSTDIISMKRWLAILEGGLLPIISLTSLHFFVKYEKTEEKKPQEVEEEKEENWKEKLAKEPIKPVNPPTGKVFYVDVENLPTKEEQEEYAESDFNLMDYDKDIYYPLVEEENPEDEVIIPTEEKPKADPKTGQIDMEYDATKLVEGEDYQTPRPPVTPGEELNRTWRNIINFRKKKNNNGIERI
jgi:hypothetical protein